MHKYRETIINMLFPRYCIVCETPGSYLCKQCKKTIEPHPEICPYCHKYSTDYITCKECCIQQKPHVEGIIIPFIYTTTIKRLIIKLKYFHKKDIGTFLAERTVIALSTNETLQQQIQYNHTYITYIPNHRRRKYMTKGYNQAEILAKHIAKKMDIPLLSIANKRKYTKAQASLKREGRLRNLTNAFILNNNLPCKGHDTLLIIDDVTTTWSTINELAKTIKQTYPQIKIRWVVLGRHI